MLSFETILNAAVSIIRERFPGETVYINLAPEDYERPSSLVELGEVQMQDASCSSIDITASIIVSLFVEVDDYHHSHIEQLMERQMAVQELFAVSGLRVGDRVLHVVGNTGEYNFNFAEVTITLNYQDDRPAEEREFPVAAEVATNIERSD